MALTAKFTADFTSFYSAVEKAEDVLVDLSKGANKVDASLKRMVDGFSGRKLIQEATLLAESVQAVGGATKLTDAELRRVAATTAEAADKMRRMGMEVPKSFTDIATAAKRLDTSIEQIDEALEKAQAEAKRTADALAKLDDQFSGKNIIQEANLMAAAIQKAGGTSKLTDAELKRVAATVSEATAKMKAMGVDVPPGMQKLADATKGVGESAKKSTSLLSGMAGQLAGMFTIGAVVAFGREILQAGDQIQKMADQTGLTVEEVQKLQHIAGQSGTSIESLVGAVQNLQQRLGDDNSGAAGAIKKLGINLNELKSQTPYQQMVTLAEGIRNIKDPTEQASEAAKIFGKSWKEILPAIKSGMEGVGNEAPLMADEVVKSLDRIGDALTRAKALGITWGATLVTAIEKAGFAVGDFLSRFNPQHFGVATSQILKMQAALNDRTGLVGALTQAQQASTKLVKVIGSDVKPVIAATAEEEYRFNQRLMDSVKANEAAARAANERAEAIQKMSKEGLGAEFEWQNQILLTKFKLEQLTVVEKQLYEQTRTMTDFVVQHKGEMFPEPPQSTLEAWKKGQKAIETTMPLMMKLESVARSSIGGLNDIFQRAFEGGGGAAGAIKSFATNALGSLLKMIPGVGAVLSQFAGTFVSLISKVFGKSEETSKVSPLRDEFFKLQGGIEALNPKVMQLTGNLKLVQAVFDARTVEQYNKAIGELTDLFELQTKALGDVDATAKKYGLTIEDLGPAWAKQELDKKAQELWKDYQLLISAGADHTKVLEKMSGAVNEYVNNAMKMGSEVPEAMRPMLEAMIQNGTLLDANGNKITNLEESGISFAMTMTEGFKSLIEEVQKLTDIISRSLGTALKKIPKPDAPWEDWPPPPEMPDYSGNNNSSAPAWGGPQAMGSAGRVTKPTLFLAGEAGAEDFAFSGANKRFNGGTDGGITINVQGSVISERQLAQIVNDANERRYQNKRYVRAG